MNPLDTAHGERKKKNKHKRGKSEAEVKTKKKDVDFYKDASMEDDDLVDYGSCSETYQEQVVKKQKRSQLKAHL